MSHQQYLTTLQRELQKINEEIDTKIISGQMYANEARKHRILLARIRKHTRSSFFGKLFATLKLTF
jgi:hypothetical protein